MAARGQLQFFLWVQKTLKLEVGNDLNFTITPPPPHDIIILFVLQRHLWYV